MHEIMELNLVLLRSGKYWTMSFKQANLVDQDQLSQLLTTVSSADNLDSRHDLKKYVLLTADIDQFVGNAVEVSTLDELFAN